MKSALSWDVMSGVARRSWARNENSIETVIEFNKMNEGTDHITVPYIADEDAVKSAVAKIFNK